MENTNYINDQVFISFRGKDERCGFLTYLKQRLLESNVNVFIDENAAGEPLENLFGHIRKSRIAIVIVSKNYAESSWCLDELVEIKKCMETEKLNAVIPIFRKVKVSSVRKQSGKFGERIKRWKKALEFVTGMIGLTYDKKFSRSEFEFVGKVVEKVHKTLGKTAAKAGRNSTPETSKEKLSYLFVFNINHSNVNGLIHSSRTLEALTLNLDRLNPERSTGVDLNPSSGHYRRTASYRDERDRFDHLPFEEIMDQKRADNQRSIDNIVERKYRHGTTFLSPLRYYFELCLCLPSEARDYLMESLN
ncbi:BnaC01g15330D [Brassica napus]|uniref:BnaC01g15330D protein n=2 Tax=Brassica TaxID=3705 RepID=A0A078J2D4_BRANA|nr:BnaC01g15330D [Brassica napus]VDD49400.1 unnamed protein product [Brassica oleracea]